MKRIRKGLEKDSKRIRKELKRIRKAFEQNTKRIRMDHNSIRLDYGTCVTNSPIIRPEHNTKLLLRQDNEMEIIYFKCAGKCPLTAWNTTWRNPCPAFRL